jgi:hypothetical protein
VIGRFRVEFRAKRVADHLIRGAAEVATQEQYLAGIGSFSSSIARSWSRIVAISDATDASSGSSAEKIGNSS